MKSPPKDTVTNLVSLDNARPHVAAVSSNLTTHILPAALISDIATGKKDITDVKDWQLVVRAIFREWLEIQLRDLK